MRSIHAAVGNPDIAAGIDVETIAVGINLDVIESEIVDAGGEYAEVAAVKDADVADERRRAAAAASIALLMAGLSRAFPSPFAPYFLRSNAPTNGAFCATAVVAVE